MESCRRICYLCKKYYIESIVQILNTLIQSNTPVAQLILQSSQFWIKGPDKYPRVVTHAVVISLKYVRLQPCGLRPSGFVYTYITAGKFLVPV